MLTPGCCVGSSREWSSEKDREAMAEWVKVAAVGELAPGQKKQIDLDGVAVALFNVDG